MNPPAKKRLMVSPEELIEVCEEAGIALPEDLKEVDILTPYAVETRYPGY